MCASPAGSKAHGVHGMIEGITPTESRNRGSSRKIRPSGRAVWAPFAPLRSITPGEIEQHAVDKAFSRSSLLNLPTLRYATSGYHGRVGIAVAVWMLLGIGHISDKISP